MWDQRVTNWVQIGTGIALVLGLLLVLIELRQAKELTLAELSSQGFAEAMENYRTVMGEESAAALALACEAPDQLSPQQLVILQAVYSADIAQISRLRVLESIADFGVPWQALARQQLAIMMSSEPGRWWAQHNLAVDPEMVPIIQEMLASPQDCRQYYDQFSQRQLGPNL